MELNARCQSCAMPLGMGFYGSNANGVDNHEYCRFCYSEGKFTNPNLTLGEMMAISKQHMMKDIGMTEDKAREIAAATIPKLKRWVVCGVGKDE